MMARANTSWPNAAAYLESFDIDPGSVARSGLSPEGYRAPDGKIRQMGDNGWEAGWAIKPWPAGFDYEEFNRLIWQDEFRVASS